MLNVSRRALRRVQGGPHAEAPVSPPPNDVEAGAFGMSELRVDLYRMVMPQHECPYGLKSKWLLEHEGYEVADHHLRSRQETDEFKERHQVQTTPQTFINGQRVGGYDDLRRYFNKGTQDRETSYQPVVALFSLALLAAGALSFNLRATVFSLNTVEWFVTLSVLMLAMLKLRDVRSFSTMFLNYDLLAKRWVPYAFVYPFLEALVAISMLSGAFMIVSGPVAVLTGVVGSVSVAKAVWVDGRELKCACAGGSSNVPLGFVSLTENLAMVAMGVWMLAKVILWG